MQLIALVDMYGDYGTVLEGQFFECPDYIAVELLKQGKVRRPEPPKILYEKTKEEKEASNLRNESDHSKDPLVTALCITRNRRQWLSKAIACFQSQTYSNKELLIVADGEDVRDLVPNDPRIRLLHIEEGYLIGQKRNFGCERASGEIIATWDDDDEYAPERLSDQVARLISSGVCVTGYHTVEFLNFQDGSIWQYRGGSSYAIGASLCFRRSHWERYQFPAKQIGEDGDFVRHAASLKQLLSVNGEKLMRASIHPGNTSTRVLSGSSWRRLN